MLSNISWQAYWISIVALTLIYYGVIYLVYFKKELAMVSYLQTQIRKSTASENEESLQATLPGTINSRTGQVSKDRSEDIVYACMDELNAFFENQKKSKVIKTELMYALYSILQKYPSLRNSEYKESLTNVIATQCEHICSIHLNAEEMKGVWFG